MTQIATRVPSTTCATCTYHDDCEDERLSIQKDMPIECCFDYERKPQPPTCPECGAELKTIYEEVHNGYYWIEDDDEYQEGGQGSVTYTCGECGKEIGGTNNGEIWGYIPEQLP